MVLFTILGAILGGLVTRIFFCNSDEMKSTGKLYVIRNTDVRRSILESYNQFNLYVIGRQAIYSDLQQYGWKLTIENVEEFENSNLEEGAKFIQKFFSDFRFRNQVKANNAVTLNASLREIISVNKNLLRDIRKELNNINRNS